jgi:4-hydroxybenzoate polyprenyltransferase
LFDINPEWYYTLGLFLAVWSIYLADHLVDVFKNPNSISTERRTFYLRYKVVFSILLAISLLAAFVLFLNLDLPIQKRLAFLISGVIAYLVFASSIRYPVKELTGALLYSLGIFFIPFLYQPGWLMVIFALEVFLCAWTNMLVMSALDYESDLKEGFNSFATLKGKEVADKLLKGILGIYLVFFAVGFLVMNETPAMIFHMSLLFCMLTQWVVYGQKQSWLNRFFSDLGFLWPTLLFSLSYYALSLF